MTRCQVFESLMNKKKTENNLASSKEGDGKDNCKISDVHLPDIVERKEKNKCEKEAEKSEQHSENTCPRRPRVMFAKFIRTNARFYNEPVCYIEHPNMGNKQREEKTQVSQDPQSLPSKDLISSSGNKEAWWSHEEILNHHCVPSYDFQSTQRSDFKIPACPLVLPTKYYRKQKAACGIVPLAISDTLPVIENKFSHRFPFIHLFRKSLPPKHHGAFQQTGIKPVRGPGVPKGTEVFQSAPGLCLPEQSKTERGNSMTTTVTSSSSGQSKRSSISECHLSETDVKEATSQLLGRNKRVQAFLGQLK
uniref:Uncharacterized protein n=1 Tax=Vombatus ursinus TaxID=29139 RepID=A0A4X2L4X4_VOMUR